MPNHSDNSDHVEVNTEATSVPINRPSIDKKMVTVDTASKAIAPMQQRLMLTWSVWLVYRLLGLPILISLLNQTHPDIIGGIAWQGLWLIPAFIVTPWMLRGRSPYALLVASMLTLVYLGASGVVLFTRVYGSSGLEIIVYMADFALLLLINIWLFMLLKRLPSMNNVVKKPRSH